MSRRKLFLFWLLCASTTVVGALFGQLWRARRAPVEWNSLWSRALCQWDCAWYADIADRGYFYTPGEQSSVAFFPVYPLLVRGLSALTQWSSANAAPLMTLLSSLAAVVLFWKWTEAFLRNQGCSPKRTEVLTQIALACLVLYPYSVYLFGIGYSDASFLALAAGAFWALERRRLTLCILFAMAATACRPVAPALVVGLLARSWELTQKEGRAWFQPRTWLPALGGLGLVAYMVFLDARFGNAQAFVETQSAAGWDQTPGLRTWLKLALFENLARSGVSWESAEHLRNALVSIAALGLALRSFAALGRGYGLAALALVGMGALGSKDLHSVPRYAIGAFPLFLTAAVELEVRLAAPWRRALAAAAGLCLFYFAAMFGRGSYLA